MSFNQRPPRPSARDGVVDGEVLFMQMLWDFFFDPKVSFFIDHPNLKFSKTPRGFVPKIRIPNRSGGGSGQVAPFKITDTFVSTTDYIKCVQVAADGTPGTTPVYVAKHYKDRPSITTDTLSGLAVTYTYTDNFNRTTTQGTNSQKEQLFRLPITDDIIFCGKLPFPDPDIVDFDVVWVDLTPRVWARKKDQS